MGRGLFPLGEGDREAARQVSLAFKRVTSTGIGKSKVLDVGEIAGTLGALMWNASAKFEVLL